MPRTELPNGAELPETPSSDAPQEGDNTAQERADRAASSALSWKAVKERFEPRVEQEGFDLPEPDSPEFPYFLAKLNAVNPSLTRELVNETRRLRREVDMPSPRASRRRERNRATRRILFMRQTPDGRWVYDKDKAPVYGMTALLLVGGLMTAVYALPRLNGQPATSASAAAAPVGTPEPAGVQAPANQAESEAALERSREELARFRRERSAREAAERAAQRGLTADNGAATSSTTKIKPLGGEEPNPPAPPATPTRTVQTPITPAPSVYTPVPRPPPAPQPVSTPAPAPAPAPVQVTPPATPPPEPARAAPAPVRQAAVTTPAPTRRAAPVTPSSPAPVRSAAATPSPAHRAASVPPSPTRNAAEGAPVRTPAAPQPETPDVSASFGALPVMPPPVDPSPVVASPSQDTSAAPVSSAAFGGVPESVAIPGASAAPEAPSPQFASGLVYERASQSTAVPGAASGALPAETPFGSSTTNPASQIGATGPFTPLQQVPATLITAISALNGASVPAVAVTADGGSFIGVGTINATLARVDMTFRRYVASDGKVYAVDAIAYAQEAAGLTQGLRAEIRPVAPTLALDAAQNSANALNTFVQNAASAAAKGAQGNSVAIGDNLTISGPSAASLAQTLLGGLGSTFRLPENTQTISRIANVNGGTPMTVIVGLGGEGR
ncbi:hypothetical protein [Deinococcus terrestris]|uniref:hypothetical protein n=1 Tax=Deinococcus terrestris TaxID=2651870 RepID=UPI001883B461|nr:hypothetical protein [Deinococcus terrestris]